MLDLSNTEVELVSEDVVELTGAIGHPAPSDLKSLQCNLSGWFAEGSIVYLGTTAEYRVTTAKRILKERINTADRLVTNIRYEVFCGHMDGVPQAVLQMAVRSNEKQFVEFVMNELDALYLNGPAAGGGIRTHILPRVDTIESYVSRHTVGAARVEVAR